MIKRVMADPISFINRPDSDFSYQKESEYVPLTPALLFQRLEQLEPERVQSPAELPQTDSNKKISEDRLTNIRRIQLPSKTMIR